MMHYKANLIDNDSLLVLNDIVFNCPILSSNRALMRRAKKLLNVSYFKSVSTVHDSGLIYIKLHGASVHIKIVPI